MLANHLRLASLGLIAAVIAAAAPAPKPLADPQDAADGVVQVPSAYPMDETINRLKQDIASKGITFFTAIDQSKLAADAGIALHPSTLLVFGNPALGARFVTSKAVAGLDWPVRLLVYQDQTGKVWTAYTDFMWIARRHQITDRDAAFNKASEVITSITSSINDGKE
jgi:uncharacterized protein (DUF302 family)